MYTKYKKYYLILDKEWIYKDTKKPTNEAESTMTVFIKAVHSKGSYMSFQRLIKSINKELKNNERKDT